MSENWLDHSCQVEVPLGIEPVWELWSDLAQMPNWMKWIRSVELLDGDRSRWTLDTRGLIFSWISQTHTVIPHQLIGWQSVDGLPNRGALRFYDRKDQGTIVKLTVSYAVPGWLSVLLDNGLIRNAVEGTLQADLNRFRDYALAQTVV